MGIDEIKQSVTCWGEFEEAVTEEFEEGAESKNSPGIIGLFSSDASTDVSGDVETVYEQREQAVEMFEAKHNDLQKLIETLQEAADGESGSMSDEAVRYYDSITPVVESCRRLLTEQQEFLTVDEQETLQGDIMTAEGLRDDMGWRIEYGEVIDDVKPDVKSVKETVVSAVQRSCSGSYDADALDGMTYSSWVEGCIRKQRRVDGVSRSNRVTACKLCVNSVNSDLMHNNVVNRVKGELERIESRISNVQSTTDEVPEKITDIQCDVEVLHGVVNEYNSVIADRHVGVVMRRARRMKTRVVDVVNSEVSDGRVEVGSGEFDVENTPGGVNGAVKVVDEGLLSDVRDVESELRMVTSSRVLQACTGEKAKIVTRLHEEVQLIVQRVSEAVDSDDVINNVIEDVDSFRESVEPVLERGEYVNSDEKQALLRECDDVVTNVTSVAEEITGSVVASDRQRVREMKRVVEQIREDVRQCNSDFVNEKRSEYKSMFSNMGEENVSLNTQQEYAVFRNDKHNKVNAGAGTGKTFSVACRVQYLLCEGVDEGDIIALTFLREAADTMKQRLRRIFGVEGVAMRTLHSFGKEVLDEFDDDGFQLEGEPRIGELHRLVKRVTESDDALANSFNAFKSRYKERECDLEPEIQENVVEEYENRMDVTMYGEEIMSEYTPVKRAHSDISQWLAARGITYEYRVYPECEGLQGIEPTRSDVYLPEFALPEHNIVLEYYPSEDVREKQEWYEQKTPPSEMETWFENTDWDVVVVTGEGDIADVLTRELRKYNVAVDSELQRKEYIKNTYQEIIVTRGIVEEIGDFVQLGKANNISEEEVMGNVVGADPEIRLFSEVASAVLNEYRQRYDEIGAYDYTDMIVEARELLESERLPDSLQFEHVIVDEFQDLSRVQIEFIETLLAVNDATLFAVGDDWQSIYGFKGARPEYFVEFDEYFTPATETRLEENYRCPPDVVAAGNDLIEQNEMRTMKEVEAAKQSDATPTVHAVAGDSRYRYVQNAALKIEKLVVDSIMSDDRDASDIVVIVRNKEGTILPNQIRRRILSHGIETGENGVSVKTAHQMKGMEEEHVIIANVGNLKKDSFPTAERDKELLQGVSVDTGSHIEEERRLFYVAVTRAKQRLDLQIETGEKPVFVDEIKDYVTIADEDSTGELRVTGTVTSTTAMGDESELKQIGELETDDGHVFEYVIPTDSTIAPLDEAVQYSVLTQRLGEYNATPQLVFDDDSRVTVTR